MTVGSARTALRCRRSLQNRPTFQQVIELTKTAPPTSTTWAAAERRRRGGALVSCGGPAAGPLANLRHTSNFRLSPYHGPRRKRGRPWMGGPVDAETPTLDRTGLQAGRYEGTYRPTGCGGAVCVGDVAALTIAPASASVHDRTPPDGTTTMTRRRASKAAQKCWADRSRSTSTKAHRPRVRRAVAGTLGPAHRLLEPDADTPLPDGSTRPLPNRANLADLGDPTRQAFRSL